MNGYVLDSTPIPVEITTAGQTVTINATNAPAKGGIAITKTDADTGAVIAGVHFILYDGNNNPVTEGDTLADGTLAFSDLMLGTYSLIETYTPTGYVLDSTPRTVSITENGQTVEIAVTNGTAIGSIAITKMDASTGAPLSGVHFILTDSTGATVSGGGTDENGVLIFSSLPLGTYTLMETETRNGYVLDSTPREVTISENGQIVEVGMGNTPARGSVSVIKTDAETGIPLAGVHFQLRDEAGALCAEGDTSADGTLTLSSIPLGSYTIQETTTPEGYVPDPTLRTVNITEDGQTVQITVENTPIRGSLEIIKKDVYDEIPLMGAGFRLYDSTGTQVAEGYTNAEGKLSFSGLAQGNYTFREFKAPKGYIPDDSVHTFTVSDVGAPITKTVTNDIVTVWRTRHQGAGVIESNVYARAVNETPYYPPWPDIVVTTNKAEQTVAWTNWVERVVAGVSVTTNSETRFLRREFTNTLLSATLSGGYYHTNDVGAALMPGDRLVAEGTALNGGKAVIVIER